MWIYSIFAPRASHVSDRGVRERLLSTRYPDSKMLYHVTITDTLVKLDGNSNKSNVRLAF